MRFGVVGSRVNRVGFRVQPCSPALLSANLYTSISPPSRTLSELVVDSSCATGRAILSPDASTGYWRFTNHEASRDAGSLDGEHESRGAERRAGDGPRLQWSGRRSLGAVWRGTTRIRCVGLSYSRVSAASSLSFFLMIIIRTTMRQVVSLSLVTDTVRSRSHPGHRRCFVLGRTQTWMPRTRAHAPVLSGLVFSIVAVLLARTLETCVPLAHCAQRATRNLPWPGSLAES